MTDLTQLAMLPRIKPLKSTYARVKLKRGRSTPKSICVTPKPRGRKRTSTRPFNGSKKR